MYQVEMSNIYLHFPTNWMPLSMNVLMIVKRVSYKFSILYFSKFILTGHQYHIAFYHHQEANPPITKKSMVCWPPNLFPWTLFVQRLWHDSSVIHHNIIQVSMVVTDGLVHTVFYLKFFEHPSFGQVTHEINPSEWKVHSSEISITIIYCWYMFLMAVATGLTHVTILI